MQALFNSEGRITWIEGKRQASQKSTVKCSDLLILPRMWESMENLADNEEKLGNLRSPGFPRAHQSTRQPDGLYPQG